MSLKYEQYRALYDTRTLLTDLLFPRTAPKNRSEMVKRASHCLRHFPHLRPNGEPMFSKDEFPTPNIERHETKV